MDEEYESVWQALIDMGLPEEDVEAVLRLAEMQGGLDIAQTRADYADPQGLRAPRGRWMGRVYRQAHPLEHISHGVEKTFATIERQKAIERQEKLLQEMVEARKKALQMGPKTAAPGAATPGAARTYPYGGKAGSPTTGWVPIP